MTEQTKKPRIRIHYVTAGQDGCTNGKCVGKTLGCDNLLHKKDEYGRENPVCCNRFQVGQPATWFELIAKDHNDNQSVGEA